MATTPHQPGKAGQFVRDGFTLVELLIVIAILGILSALVMPKYFDASSKAGDSAIRSQLNIVRNQIELYRADSHTSPSLVTQQWTQMVAGDYFRSAPVNPLNDKTTVAAAPAVGIGWVWRDSGNGIFGIYATTEAETVELAE